METPSFTQRIEEVVEHFFHDHKKFDTAWCHFKECTEEYAKKLKKGKFKCRKEEDLLYQCL
jgi:hypothetical protein